MLIAYSPPPVARGQATAYKYVQRTGGLTAGGPSSQSPFRVSGCVARIFNANGQSRVSLSLQQGAFQSSLWAMPGGEELKTRPKRSVLPHRVPLLEAD